MIVFPNCKINLGLNILRKRRDGFHDLETVFYPIPLTDALEVIDTNRDQAGPDLKITGIGINGDTSSNLCIKAYRIIKKEFPQLPPVQMHLHKSIPAGAGLGGGSADAAFTLKLLNKRFHLNISNVHLMQYASELGSDCPFFIINNPCFASGRGEILEEINLSLAGYKLLIVNPNIHIETGLAFLQVAPSVPQRSVKEIIADPIERWKKTLRNDFEIPAFKKYPVLKAIKEKIYDAGAIYTSMTGSGSTLYGIFPGDKELEIDLPPEYFTRQLIL